MLFSAVLPNAKLWVSLYILTARSRSQRAMVWHYWPRVKRKSLWKFVKGGCLDAKKKKKKRNIAYLTKSFIFLCIFCWPEPFLQTNLIYSMEQRDHWMRQKQIYIHWKVNLARVQTHVNIKRRRRTVTNYFMVFTMGFCANPVLKVSL